MDIVLFLTDRHIEVGVRIYNLFCKQEIQFLLKYFECDFIQIKKDLGIMVDYVERSGDLYSRFFNPKRKKLEGSPDLRWRALKVYEYLLKDLEEIVNKIK